MCRILATVSLCLLASVPLAAGELERNWQADFPPCLRHAELLKSGPMTLGVRFATANRLLAAQFRGALDFWATVLDLNWHEEDSENCSIQVLDGERDLFQAAPHNIAARSQFPDRPDFRGWIAFNPVVVLDRVELYRIAVHEIGHMLGLQHSADPRSVMYGLDVEGQEFLDTADLTMLAAHHKLRIASIQWPVRLVPSR